MSLSYFLKSVASPRPSYYPIKSLRGRGMADQQGAARMSTQCQCPTDEDKQSTLKAENVKREERMHSLITEALNPAMLQIEDVSGGCGAMFVITVQSEKFRDKKLIEQHRMVNAVLKEEMKSIHAITLNTSVPK